MLGLTGSCYYVISALLQAFYKASSKVSPCHLGLVSFIIHHLPQIKKKKKNDFEFSGFQFLCICFFIFSEVLFLLIIVNYFMSLFSGI